MGSLGKIAKPTRTLMEELELCGYKSDNVGSLVEMTGEQGLIAVTTGAQPTSGEVTRNGGGMPSRQAPAGGTRSGAPAAAPGMGADDDDTGAEVEIKKESRLKKRGFKKENAPPAVSQNTSMPGTMPGPAQPMTQPEAGKRTAGESTGKSSTPDKLEVILSDLQGLVNESKNFDVTKSALVRSYANIAKIAQAVSEKLDESVSGNKDLFWSLDELAEEALQVAEGLVEGTVRVSAAHEGINGYVTDLITHLGPIAGELDSNIAAVLKSMAQK